MFRYVLEHLGEQGILATAATRAGQLLGHTYEHDRGWAATGGW